MSVREEEERRKNECPSRGLGLAAAAIGVGVGAALYYFFNKRSENPNTEGSTSSNWVCEDSQALTTTDLQHPMTMSDNESITDFSMDEDDYLTISEHSTTDTSIAPSETSTEINISISPNSNESGISTSVQLSITTNSDDTDNEDSSLIFVNSSGVYAEISAESEMNDDWEMTSESADVPTDTMQRSPVHRLVNIVVDLLTPTSDSMRSSFRQRSWSLEECSICCEVMLKDQELEELPCAHSFHAACVRPWLNEQRTCPNCRKLA